MNELTTLRRERDTLKVNYDESVAKILALRREREELSEALQDAAFLLGKCGINWKEAGSMADSMKRSASDANALLARLKP